MSNTPFGLASYNIAGISAPPTMIKLYDPHGIDHNNISLNNNAIQYCIDNDISILCLQETKMHDESKTGSTLEIIDRHGLNRYTTLDNNNRDKVSKGGTSIIFLDTSNISNIRSLYSDYSDLPQWINLEEPNASSGRIQIASFEYKNQTYYIVNVYAPATSTKEVKISFFNHLKELLELPKFSPLKHGNTIIMGDWNIVEKPSRDVIKVNGDVNDNSPSYLESLASFMDFINTNSLIDPLVFLHENEEEADNDGNLEEAFKHSAITFRHRDRNYYARLDRFYVNPGFIERVTQVSTPLIHISDHFPIKLLVYPNENPPPIVDYGNDVFKIIRDVIVDKAIKKRVNKVIRAAFYNAHFNIDNDPSPFTTHWEQAKHKIYIIYEEATKSLQRQIKDAQKKYDLITNEKSTYSDLEKQQAKVEYELFVEQKHSANMATSFAYSHSQDEGLNKQFFNKQKRMRRARSTITSILKQDTLEPVAPNIIRWEDDAKGLMNVMKSYWKNILRKRIDDNDNEALRAQNEILDTLGQYLDQNGLKLSDEDIQILGDGLKKEEIIEAINGIRLGKSCGKDGLPIEFYVTHTRDDDKEINHNYLTNTLYKVYQESHRNERLPHTQLENIVTLIFKKEFEHDKVYTKNYRPITLQNLDYKILYKALANRLKKVIHKLVPHFQHAYVPKRRISDAILLMKAIVHKVNNDKKGAAALFMDAEKAFDSVDHSFTIKILEKVNLPNSFIKWIKMAFDSSQMQLNINGYLTDPFSMDGGGKQGDPLYPYIFIIVMGAAASLIETDDSIQGVKLTHSPTPIKTFQYADDCPYLIGDPNDITHIKQHIALFCKASGMKINGDKTDILLLGGWNDTPPLPLRNSGFKLVKQKDTLRVLGIQLGTSNSHAQNWSKVISKIRTYITNNPSTHLTINGQIILANSCITSQTIFLATHQHSPITELNKVKSAINAYTNPQAQTISYTSFNDKCKPHDKGGPLTTLLNPYTLCPLQSTKWIYDIATNYPLNMQHPTWHGEWIDTIFRYVSEHFCIYYPDHILSSRLDINEIQSTYTYDPHIINALKHWNDLKFKRTPNLNSYEDCSTLPIWNNPFITKPNGACFSKKNPISSIEKLKPLELYHIGSLFTNFNHTQYFNGVPIPPGNFLSNAQLTHEYPTTLSSDWDELKHAISNSPFYNTIRHGIHPFEHNEFVATIEMHRRTYKILDIYRVKKIK